MNKTQLNELAKAHALDVLGPDQFKSNKVAVREIAATFKDGYAAAVKALRPMLITAQQKQQFNSMLGALTMINKGFGTPEYVKKNAEKLYGLDDGDEALEMAYENMQGVAQSNSNGVRPLK